MKQTIEITLAPGGSAARLAEMVHLSGYRFFRCIKIGTDVRMVFVKEYVSPR